MNNTYSKSEQNEQSPISPSLRLGLTAAILTTIADGLAALAILTAMDEAIIDSEKEKQDQKELDESLKKCNSKLTN